MKTEIQTKLELAEILVKHLDCKDTSKALTPLYDYMKEQFFISRVVERSEQLVCEKCRKPVVEPYAERYGKKFCLGCM